MDEKFYQRLAMFVGIYVICCVYVITFTILYYIFEMSGKNAACWSLVVIPITIVAYRRFYIAEFK